MNRSLLILLISACSIFWLAGSASSQVPPPFLLQPQQSTATPGDALAVLSNPAGLGIHNGESSLFLAPYYKKTDFGDWGLLFNEEGFGFAAEIISNPTEMDSDFPNPRRRFTWGLGGGNDNVYFGFAYSWTTRVDRQNNWDFGMLFRPYNFLSAGAVLRGVNTPRIGEVESNIGYDLGIAVRPLGLLGSFGNKHSDRVTLTADAYLRKFDTVAGQESEGYTDEIDYKFGAAVQVIPGITAHVDLRPELKGVLKHYERIYGGLTFNFGHGSVGTYQEDGTGRGTAYIGTFERVNRTILTHKKKKFVEIELSGPIIEHNRDKMFFKTKYRTIHGFHRDLDRLAKDPAVEGILLKIGDINAGWAKHQEMRNALLKFRESGKKIVVYMESCGNSSYYLASSADKIYLTPSSEVYLTGLAAHMLFVRGTLDKIGIDPQLEHIGDYKSASDMFTREDMSEAQAEATNAVLDDIYDELVSAIARGRNMDEDEVRALVDKGPFTSDEAFKAGLVDSLVYEDQLKDLVHELSDGKPSIVKECRLSEKKGYRSRWEDMRRKKIAIVYGTGAITSGKSSGDGFFGGESMGSVTIAEAIRQARNDDDVAAIVFRVDSPGGSGLASEVILREVKLCTEGDNKKPIIVSMSDVAGSGGYYVACLADKIVAMPNTITGSIGVVSGKFTYDEFQRKIGINTATLRRGKHADMYAGYRSFTDEEREKLHDHIEQFYNIFIGHVAAGRGMDTSRVHEIAQGRIWSGSDAKEMGLIDETGGLDLALELAAKAAGIKEGEDYAVKIYPKRKKFDFEFGFETMVRNSLPANVLEAADILADETRWEDGEILYLMPYRLDIE